VNDRQAEAECPPVVHYGIRQVGVCGQRDAWRGKGRLVPGGHYLDGKRAPKIRLIPRSHYTTTETKDVTCPGCRAHPALTLLLESRRLLDAACKEWRPEWTGPGGYKSRKVAP
jgi:hypothetical protein